MPRTNRPRRAGRPRPGQPEDDAGQRPLLGGRREERAADGVWHVRTVPGAAARKEYRCPGCSQAIAPGTPHVLAWPATEGLGVTSMQDAVQERRHWHRACWDRRTRLPPR